MFIVSTFNSAWCFIQHKPFRMIHGIWNGKQTANPWKLSAPLKGINECYLLFISSNDFVYLISTRAFYLFNCKKRDKIKGEKTDLNVVKNTRVYRLIFHFHFPLEWNCWRSWKNTANEWSFIAQYSAHSQMASFVSIHHKDVSIEAINLYLMHLPHVYHT